MNTQQIERVINKDKILKKIFIGVFASDKLPVNLISKKPAALIINFDEHSRSGSHWVAIFFPFRGNAILFDSYGKWPLKSSILTFLDRNSKSGWEYNSDQIQDMTTDTCGFHCILFLQRVVRGMPYKLKFSGNTKTNDKKVKNLVSKFLK